MNKFEKSLSLFEFPEERRISWYLLTRLGIINQVLEAETGLWQQKGYCLALTCAALGIKGILWRLPQAHDRWHHLLFRLRANVYIQRLSLYIYC